jgi:hypothetical protein
MPTTTRLGASPSSRPRVALRSGPARATAGVVASACLAFAGLVASPTVQAATAGGSAVHLTAIQPGQHPVVHVATPVNLVFVGYPQKAVDTSRIVSQLPTVGDPTVREQSFWNHPQDVGLRYDYQYKVRFAGTAFDNAFFSYLASSGLVGGTDGVSSVYNAQQHNALDVGSATSTDPRPRRGSSSRRR